MSPITITALIIFAVTYILMLAFQKIRPHITVVSALIFVALGIVASVNPSLFGKGFFALSSGSYSYSLGSALSEIDYYTIVPVIAGDLGIEPTLLYYGLLCGATLGGNLTPIGASANIAGIGILRKEGHEVKATTFMKYGVPFTLAAVITGYLLLWLIRK